ncbi:MAG: hypothetical protein ACM3KH_00235 [Thiobacillus sp.]
MVLEKSNIETGVLEPSERDLVRIAIENADDWVEFSKSQLKQVEHRYGGVVHPGEDPVVANFVGGLFDFAYTESDADSVNTLAACLTVFDSASTDRNRNSLLAELAVVFAGHDIESAELFVTANLVPEEYHTMILLAVAEGYSKDGDADMALRYIGRATLVGDIYDARRQPAINRIFSNINR